MESNYANFFHYNGISVDDRVFREVGFVQSGFFNEYCGQASSLDMFLRKVAFWVKRDQYSTEYEAAAAEIAASTLGKGGNLTVPDISVSFPKIIKLILIKKSAVYDLDLTAQIIYLFAENIAPYGHYAELCMSWIDTFSSFKDIEKAGGSRYRKVIVDCPVDVTVRDSSGTIVGEIKNDEVHVIENGIVTRIDEDEQKLFFLPIDEEYTIEIKATDDGEVNYSIQEYDFDRCITEKAVNYKGIEIKKGDELLGTATDIPEEEDAVYTLKYAEDEDLLEPDEILSGAEVDEYLVEVTDSENGTVTGGGFYIKGEFAQVTATADEGWKFDGWYSDGEQVSTESEYRFAVENDITLEAVFSRQSVEFKGKTTRGDMFNLANNVKVTWKEVPGARYYKVYREGITDKKESRKEPVIVTSGLVGWDKDSGLTNGHAYRYRIVASLTGKGDSSGDSPLFYSKVMYRLKTVVIRSVKNTAPGKVTVKYDKTSSGDSYVLQYCERQDMVGAKTKVVLGANNNSYTIGGLKKDKTYYISIRVRKKVSGIDYYTTFGVPKKIKIEK